MKITRYGSMVREKYVPNTCFSNVFRGRGLKRPELRRD